MHTAGAMISTLTNTAVDGIVRYYAGHDRAFHYTVRPGRDGRLHSEGYSLRYAAISQIGIGCWLKHHPQDVIRLPDLHQKISDPIHTIDDIGDAALWVWAACESRPDAAGEFVGSLIRLWESQSKGCNAVELAWVLKACAMVHESCPDQRAKIEPLMKAAGTQLRGLFSPEAKLFRRHARRGWTEGISGRIA